MGQNAGNAPVNALTEAMTPPPYTIGGYAPPTQMAPVPPPTQMQPTNTVQGAMDRFNNMAGPGGFISGMLGNPNYQKLQKAAPMLSKAMKRKKNKQEGMNQTEPAETAPPAPNMVSSVPPTTKKQPQEQTFMAPAEDDRFKNMRAAFGGMKLY